jgi:hypothetical protein
MSCRACPCLFVSHVLALVLTGCGAEERAASDEGRCERLFGVIVDACGGSLPTDELGNFFRHCPEALGDRVAAFVDCGLSHPEAACEQSGPCVASWLAVGDPPCEWVVERP